MSKARFTLGVRANVQPRSSIPVGAKVEISHKGFTLGVRANVQPRSSIPIGIKVEISHKGFTLGVKAEIEKKKFNLPQVLINAELMALYWPQAWKKDTIKIWEANLQPLGAIVATFLNTSVNPVHNAPRLSVTGPGV